jgi:hypothetical protein
MIFSRISPQTSGFQCKTWGIAPLDADLVWIQHCVHSKQVCSQRFLRPRLHAHLHCLDDCFLLIMISIDPHIRGPARRQSTAVLAGESSVAFCVNVSSLDALSRYSSTSVAPDHPQLRITVTLHCEQATNQFQAVAGCKS